MDYEQLFAAHYMQVYSYVMTLAKNAHLAEEITQKAFFKAMTTKAQHFGQSSEYTWLCAIARNTFLDEKRKTKPEESLPRDIPSPVSIENAVLNEDTAFDLHRVLHGLDEPYKEVFQLRIFGELSFLKIAMLFGKTESWARVTYHRARMKIHERMEDK